MGSHPQLLICLWALPPDSMSWLWHCRAVALQGTSKKVWNRKGMCTDWLLRLPCVPFQPILRLCDGKTLPPCLVQL